jgi:hypothetical protein
VITFKFGKVDQFCFALWTFSLIQIKPSVACKEIKHASKTGSTEGIAGGVPGHARAGDVYSQAIQTGARSDSTGRDACVTKVKRVRFLHPHPSTF